MNSNLPVQPQKSITVRCNAWTLLELLAVLAVMTLLSAIFVPMVLRDFDRAAREAEAREMSRIQSSLEQGIRRQRQIPDASTWARFAAVELGRRTEEVLTNSRGLRRLWIVDPRLRVGMAPGATLPYLQGPSGSMEPVSARVVVLSSLGEPPPSTVRDGIASSNARFDAIWSASPGTTPSGWSWSGRGEDLTVLRLDLGSLFIPVTVSQPSEPPLGRLNLDGAATNQITPVSGQSWYLRDTLLRFRGADGSDPVSVIVQAPISLSFARASWRGGLSLLTASGHANGATVEEALDRFLGAPTRASHATPVDALLTVSNYFTAYLTWARNGFPISGAPAEQVRAAADTLDLNVADLIQTP